VQEDLEGSPRGRGAGCAQAMASEHEGVRQSGLEGAARYRILHFMTHKFEVLVGKAGE
jgi:hypothetical protein